MKLEVELKAPAPRGIEKKLLSLGAKKLGTTTQKDTTYDRPGEPLRKKGITLRIRKEGKKIILTHKSKSKSKRVKAKEETELVVTPAMEVLLGGLGYHPAFHKEKKRTEYSLKGVTVCVDQVKGLGKWLDFEVFSKDPESGRKKIISVVKKLSIDESTLLTVSYNHLLREKLKSKKR